MKKLILCAALCLPSLFSNAQELEFGVKVGINTGKGTLTEINNWKNNPQSFTSFNGGVYGRFKIMLIGLYIQPEVILNSRKGTYTFTDVSNGSVFTAENNGLYMDVPVLLGLKMVKLFRVYAGPNFQFLLSQNTTINSTAAVKKNLNKQSTGVQVGVGLDIWKLRLDGKWDWTPSMGNFIEFNGVQPKLSNNMFTIQLGYKLWGIL